MQQQQYNPDCAAQAFHFTPTSFFTVYLFVAAPRCTSIPIFGISTCHLQLISTIAYTAIYDFITLSTFFDAQLMCRRMAIVSRPPLPVIHLIQLASAQLAIRFVNININWYASHSKLTCRSPSSNSPGATFSANNNSHAGIALFSLNHFSCVSANGRLVRVFIQQLPHSLLSLFLSHTLSVFLPIYALDNSFLRSFRFSWISGSSHITCPT